MIKLKDLTPLIYTWHFNIVVVSRDNTQVKKRYSECTFKEKNAMEECEVINIDSALEIGEESPITRSRDIRPILEIYVKEIAND